VPKPEKQQNPSPREKQKRLSFAKRVPKIPDSWFGISFTDRTTPQTPCCQQMKIKESKTRHFVVDVE
jgi:hypothetical protein